MPILQILKVLYEPNNAEQDSLGLCYCFVTVLSQPLPLPNSTQQNLDGSK